MTLNACQQYIRTQLDGLPSPGLPPAQAFVLPPVIVDIAEAPAIFVWGGKLVEDRYTIPRFTGQKRVAHVVYLYVQYVSDADPLGVQAFPLLLDAIRAHLRAIGLPVQLTDPATGAQSVLQNIGERIDQDYATPLAMADQRLLSNNASLQVHMAEFFTG